jgi:hypothetical protein
MERSIVRRKPIRVATMGTLPTLPNNFTGFSIDAANGLQLWKNGQLQAKYGSDGGAGVLQAYSGYQPVDSTHNCRLRYELPPNAVNIINASHLSFSLQPFRAATQGTSGASSATTTAGTNTDHSHAITIAHGTNTNTMSFDLTLGIQASGFGGSQQTGTTSADHTHNMPHTHSITAPNGLYDTGMAQGAHVLIDGVDRTTALGGPWGVGVALDVSDLNISQWITTTGWHEVALTSTALGVIVAQVTTKALLKTV